MKSATFARAMRPLHRDERQAQIEAQMRERAPLQTEIKDWRDRQAAALRTLRREVGRYLAFTRGADPAPSLARGPSLGLDLSR